MLKPGFQNVVNLMRLDRTIVGRNRREIVQNIAKVAIAGQQSGFTMQEMINFLQNGLLVETLIDLMAARLEFKGLRGQVSEVSPPPS